MKISAGGRKGYINIRICLRVGIYYVDMRTVDSSWARSKITKSVTNCNIVNKENRSLGRLQTMLHKQLLKLDSFSYSVRKSVS